MQVEFSYIHQVGKKSNQEDYIWPLPGEVRSHTNCFIVCDGVGGSGNGEIASKLVAEYIGERINGNHFEFSIDNLNKLLSESRNELGRYADEYGINPDMATTIVMAYLAENKIFVCWCGDSRIYQFRKGSILFRSDDHSLVNMLVKNGEINEAEARVHPQRNVITRAIKASFSEVEADGKWLRDVENGDFLLLCTDGLLENIADTEFLEIFGIEDYSLENIVQSIEQRCLHRTRDNYSMYLLKLKGIVS